MGAKVYADRLSLEDDSVGASPDGELEAEVQAIAAWFDALPAEWQRHFDREAESGRQAYGQA